MVITKKQNGKIKYFKYMLSIDRETRNWRMKFMNIKWLHMNEEVI